MKHKHVPENWRECFGCKMAAIRAQGGPAVKFGSGTSPASPGMSSHELFHESTIPNEARKMEAMNAAAGNKIEKLSSRRELV